jgi:hypothetical protein
MHWKNSLNKRNKEYELEDIKLECDWKKQS